MMQDVLHTLAENLKSELVRLTLDSPPKVAGILLLRLLLPYLLLFCVPQLVLLLPLLLLLVILLTNLICSLTPRGPTSGR